MEYDCTLERFLKSVEKHEMRIIKNDGIYRHIRYSEPRTSIEHFELITWPGQLCISGDMGTYVFCRVEDMFTFFRSKDMAINPGYWHEKMISDSRFVGAEEFSREVFKNIVKGEFRTACRESYIPLNVRADVWMDLSNRVLCAETEQDAHQYADSFESNGFRFCDFWEHDLKKYTYQFIWCLRAIVWGIDLFDKAQSAKQDA